MTVDVYFLKTRDISHLEKECLDENGRLIIVPSSVYQAYPQEILSQFCVVHGFYGLPTTELIEWLKTKIIGKAVEIGAAHAAIAKTLNIHACDSFQQDEINLKNAYKELGQKTVPYDYKYVSKCDANTFLKRSNYKTVIGSWVTYKYNEKEHERGGNYFGIDELKIIKKSRYILIGNERVHSKSPAMDLKHEKYQFPWLFSRSLYPEKNFIYEWNLN